MSESRPAPRRLPARPSLEQLRKRAKDHLRHLRAVDPSATLADAQLAIAREHGFESWPRLVHHVEEVQAAGRLDEFERLASDMLGSWHGDEQALRRLIAHFGVSYSPEQVRVRVRDDVDEARGSDAGEPSLDDVRGILARQYGFESWPALAEALAQPPADAAGSRLGISSAPPFYKIHRQERAIELRPPLTDRDWDTVFAVMREHGLTKIATSAFTDRAMEKLSRLDFVTSVNADGAQRLTDEGLLHLGRMPQLEELSLSGWHVPFTDRGLAMLPRLANLRRFSIEWAQRITDAGVAQLASCDHLESVNLMGTPTGDGAIGALRGKRNLQRFKTGRLVTDAGLPLLHEFPAYRTWRDSEVSYDLMSFQGEPNNLLIDGPFTDHGLAELAGLEGLFSLSFFWHSHAFTGDGLAVLSDLPNLGFVGCQGERCDDAAMRSIARIPKLRMLMAQGTVATDDGFEALSTSRTLEHLWGRECPNLTGRGFAALSSMPALQGLAVSCRRVDDDALSTLPRFPALRSLMPMDVNDAGFRHVGACEGLRALWCMYCRDTGDEATAHIASLTLELYYAGKTRITDRSLEILSRMPTLETVELWETTGITDAGVALLATLPRLRKISISGAPGVTRTQMATFPSRVEVDFGG